MVFAISLVILGFVGVACFSAALAIFSAVWGVILTVVLSIRGLYLSWVKVSSLFKRNKKCANLSL